MKRQNIVEQRLAIRALYSGYILENQHGFNVRLKHGTQLLTNPRRTRDYVFDYPTWVIIGRISFWERIKNVVALLQ